MRRIAVLLALLGLGLVAPRSGEADAEPPGRGVIEGTVVGLAPDATATVELRRLGRTRPSRYFTWSRPWAGSADPENFEPWLSPGRGAGAPDTTLPLAAGERAFVFAALVPGIYEVRVVPETGPPFQTIQPVWVDGEHVRTQVRSSRGPLTLRARLLLTDRRPFHGLVVAAQESHGLLAFPYLQGAAEVETDAEGRVAIGGFHAGPVELSAVVPGALRVRRRGVELPRDGELTWIVDGGPGLHGRIVRGEGEEPVAGATILAYRNGYPDADFALAKATSDATGSFTVPVGGAGTEVLVLAAGCTPAFFETGGEQDVGTLHLAGTASLLGRVLGPGGKALAGLGVTVEPQRSCAVPTLVTRTGPDGVYAFQDLPCGEVRLYVQDEAWVSPELEEGWGDSYDPLRLEIQPGMRRPLDLEVVPAGRVRGRVVDERGQAVAGARVVVDGALTLRESATGADGRFAVGGLAAHATYDVVVSASGRLDVRLDDVVAEVEAQEREIRVPDARTLDVDVVVGEEEAPVAAASVLVGWRRKAPWGVTTDFADRVWTDEQGRARLEAVGPGPLQVRVAAAGCSDAVLDVLQQTDASVRIRLVPDRPDPSRTIRGRVLAPPGLALEDVDLRRSGPNEALVGSWGRDGGVAVPVAADGTFEARVPEEGRYGLRAEMVKDGTVYWVQVSAVAGVDGIELHLRPAPWMRPPTRTWRFRVVDPHGRSVPVACASADVRGPNAGDHARGAVVFGEATIVAEHDAVDADWTFRDAQDVCGLWLPVGPARLERVAPDGEVRKVVLPPEEAIAGVVVGPDGRGLRGVRVHARVVASRDDHAAFHAHTALTGPDGRFRLGGLDDQPYLLRLDVPPRIARVERLLVPPGIGRHADLVVPLHEAVAPEIRIVGPDGAPLEGAELCIEPSEDDFWTFDDNVVIEGFYSGPGYVYGTTDASGRTRFTRLDPEQGYVLWVRPPEGRGGDFAPRYLPAWRPQASEELRLEPWARLEGTVRDVEGMPVADADVWVLQPGDIEPEVMARSGEDGSFTLEKLRPGPVALRASIETEPPPYGDTSSFLHTATDAGPLRLVVPR